MPVRWGNAHKFHAKPQWVTADLKLVDHAVHGALWFASTKEALRWVQLSLLLKAGAIRDLQRQVRFPLRCPTGAVVAHFVADFVYTLDGAQVIEDTKGVKTDMYKLKKKWLKLQDGLEITEA